MKNFEDNKETLRKQFDNILWIEESGASEEELNSLYETLMQQDGKESRAVLKRTAKSVFFIESGVLVDSSCVVER